MSITNMFLALVGARYLHKRDRTMAQLQFDLAQCHDAHQGETTADLPRRVEAVRQLATEANTEALVYRTRYELLLERARRHGVPVDDLVRLSDEEVANTALQRWVDDSSRRGA